MGLLIRSGRLIHRINIAAQVATTGTDGHVTLSYGAGAEVAALVIGQKGDESFAAARSESRRTIKVLLRYRDDIETTWRLVWLLEGGGEAYDVVDIDRSKRRQGELWLMCQGRKVS